LTMSQHKCVGFTKFRRLKILQRSEVLISSILTCAAAHAVP
jgi:hypothetical protein